MGLRSRSFFASVSVAAFAMTVASGVQANDSVVKAVSDPNGWAIAGHDYGNTRFSPLKQITSENVGKLQLAYSLSFGFASFQRIVSGRDRRHALRHDVVGTEVCLRDRRRHRREKVDLRAGYAG